MSEDCTGNCESCARECAERKQEQTDFTVPCNELSHIKQTIAVISGKGGVGKSAVTSLLAVLANRNGYETGILDADITGPSVPKMFGAEAYRPEACETGMFPVTTHSGIRLMSINLLVGEADTPVIWRGPLVAGTVKQFWTDVIWGDLDYLFVDMPPGTGDVPLTVFQSFPLTGVFIVTSPQDLVSLIVKKAANMARTMNIPVLGLIENFSYVTCPGCGKKIEPFGKSRANEVADALGIPFIGRLPIDPKLAEICDSGRIETARGEYLDVLQKALDALPSPTSAV